MLSAEDTQRIKMAQRVAYPDRTIIASRVLQALVSKYSLKTPQDQITVCQLSVELADELIKQLDK